MSDTPERDDANGAGGADRRFAERLATHYRPAPLSPARRARFDASLHERVAARRRTPGWLPTLAASAAALLAGLLLWPDASPTPEAGAVRTATATTWERDVMLQDADTTLPEESYLPDDYVAIAYAFIDET